MPTVTESDRQRMWNASQALDSIRESVSALMDSAESILKGVEDIDAGSLDYAQSYWLYGIRSSLAREDVRRSASMQNTIDSLAHYGDDNDD